MTDPTEPTEALAAALCREVRYDGAGPCSHHIAVSEEAVKALDGWTLVPTAAPAEGLDVASLNKAMTGNVECTSSGVWWDVYAIAREYAALEANHDN